MSKLIMILSFLALCSFPGCAVDPTQDDPQSALESEAGDTPESPTPSAVELKAWEQGIQAMQPTGTATCGALQTSCTSGSSCCSGFCMAGCHHAVQCCAAYRQACQVSTDCCGAQACFNGICVRSSCP